MKLFALFSEITKYFFNKKRDETNRPFLYKSNLFTLPNTCLPPQGEFRR